MLRIVNRGAKPVAWLNCEIKTPPFSSTARRESGILLRCLQQGEVLGLPHSRPMPSVGSHCHELRVRDADRNWRIIYRIDPDAIVVVDVFHKQTEKTPKNIIKNCIARLKEYDRED